MATGIEHGDDYVAARLSIDIPSEGVQGIRELTEGVDRFRVSMEAATRAEADFSRYLDQMAASSKAASEAQANLTQSLSAYMSLSGQLGGAQAPGSSGVPVGVAIDPFAAVAGAIGMGGAHTPGSRAPNPSDVAYQLNSMAGRSPREYLNMQAARGNISPSDTVSLTNQSVQGLADKISDRDKATREQTAKTGNPDDPYARFQSRAQGVGGLAGSIMNEIGAGTGLGFGHLALGGLNWGRKRLADRAAQQAETQAQAKAQGGGEGEDEEGGGSGLGLGGLGGLSKGLGVAGGVITAALAAYGLYQKGGQMVQGWRNVAGVRGGAGGEGFQVAMKARGLGMDPNLTNEQARSVYQALLSEGYTDAAGNGGDDVKEILISGLKQWNMSAQEMVQATKMTAHFTEMSTVTFRSYMDTLKGSTKYNWRDQGDMQRDFQNDAAQMRAQGVPYAQAAETAMRDNMMFAGDPILEGSMAHATSPQMGALMRIYGGVNVPTGIMPDDVGSYIETMGKKPEATMGVLKHLADQAKNSNRDTSGGKDPTNPAWRRAVRFFMRRLQAVQHPAGQDWNQAATLYNKLEWSGMSPADIVKQGDETLSKAKHDSGDLGVQGRGFGYGRGETSIKDFIGPGLMGGGGGHFGNKTLDRIMDAYKGGSSIEVIDEQGNASSLNTSDRNQIERLDKGELRWRHKGDMGKGITLAETPHDITDKFSTDNPAGTMGTAPGTGARGDKQGKDFTGSLSIGLTEEARRLLSVSGPNPMPLTPNGIAANAGIGTAQLNNPPPGDAPTGIHRTPR